MPHMMVEPLTKLVPLTVSVNAGDPATVVDGDREAIVGAPTVRVEAVETAPPGFLTVMLSEPALASDAVGTVAVIEVAVPAVTVRAVEPR